MLQDQDGVAEQVCPVAPGIELVLRYETDQQGSVGFHDLQLVTETFAAALATMHGKNRLYAGAWREQGWRGNVARILSKTARLRNMLWNSYPLENADEPVQDTLLDLVNLTVFALLNRRAGNEWGRGLGGN